MKTLKIDVELFKKQRDHLNIIMDSVDKESELYQSLEGIQNMTDDIFDSISEEEVVIVQDILREQQNKQYFLFGSEACEVFDEKGVEELILQIKEDNLLYKLHVAEPQDAPLKTLSAYSGWHDYSILSEEEYLQIENYGNNKS